MERFVEDARTRKIAVSAGGERCGNQGFFYRPTVLSHVDDDCMASNVEPFGPLATTAPFRTMDDAIRLVEPAAVRPCRRVMTDDLRHASAITEESRAAMSSSITGRRRCETPFGGYKDSGVGSEGGIEGLHDFKP